MAYLGNPAHPLISFVFIIIFIFLSFVCPVAVVLVTLKNQISAKEEEIRAAAIIGSAVGPIFTSVWARDLRYVILSDLGPRFLTAGCSHTWQRLKNNFLG